MLRPQRHDGNRVHVLRVSGIRPIRATELPAVCAVLRSADLPTDDIDGASPLQFWVTEANGGIAGVIGLERTGESALLRSLAVVPAQRHRRLGRELVAHVEVEARAAGFTELALLTLTAQGYFEALGYATVERARVPADVQQTAQFRSLCPASAVCMIKSL